MVQSHPVHTLQTDSHERIPQVDFAFTNGNATVDFAETNLNWIEAGGRAEIGWNCCRQCEQFGRSSGAGILGLGFLRRKKVA
ncbi:MAG TPA: hypothetical protein VMS78_01960 [Rhizomicrobium sp.]|nr:hypothetical protein [Rhizomicrobium sp.]